MLHVEPLAGRDKGVTIEIVTAQNNEIDIRLVRHPEHCCPRGMNARRNSGIVQDANPVRPAHNPHATASQSLPENLRKRLANPLDARGFRSVFKGRYEDKFLCVRWWVRTWPRLRKECWRQQHVQRSDKLGRPQHSSIIAGCRDEPS